MNTVSTVLSSGELKAYKNGQLPLRLPGEPVPGEKKKIVIPIFMLMQQLHLFHRRRMASTEDFWKKRQANGAAIDVWLLNRCGALWQLFQPPCNSGTLETLVQGEIVRKNKENKEELELEDAKTLQADQRQHLQSHLLLLRLR